jgi:zinc protease
MYASFGLRLEHLREHSAALAAATLDEVTAVAAEFLAPSRAVTVVLGDADKVAGPLAALTTVERGEA